MAGAIEERLRRSTPPLPPQTSPAKPQAADADVERAEVVERGSAAQKRPAVRRPPDTSTR